MTKAMYKLCLTLLLFIAIGCAGQQQSSPRFIDDANHFMQEGVRAYTLNDWQLAEHLFARALLIYRSIDDQQGELDSRINLAETALATENVLVCRKQLELAHDIVKHTALHSYQPRIDLLSAQLAIQQRNYPAAITHLQPLLPESGRATPHDISLAALSKRTHIAFIQNQNREIWLKRFEILLRNTKDVNPELNAALLRYLAYQAQSQADFKNAEQNLQQALTYYKERQSRIGIAATLSDLGKLQAERGQSKSARNYYLRAMKVYEYLGKQSKVAEIRNKMH